MSDGLVVGAGSLNAVGDWLTIMNAYRILSVLAEDAYCVCGCGHQFVAPDEPYFTMNFTAIPGEDTKELRIHWYHTEDCVRRYLKT